MKNRIPSLAGLALLAGALPLTGADNDELIEQLQKELQDLRKEVETLKSNAASEPLMPANEQELNEEMKKAHGLKIGFYGEAKYRVPEKGSSVFDPHRFVLLPSYQINDWLFFSSEIEIEHGGIDESASGRSRFDGEVEIEQFYVDIQLNEHFNVRSLGIDLVPVGRVNLYHEPTTFYSTERPELYREIIPSTWFEPSLGVFGKINDGLNYQLMVSSGLEDYIPGVTTPGVDGINGVRNARPRIRKASEDMLAVSGRLDYNALPGLNTSASFYTSGVQGQTGDTHMTLLDAEALYRLPGTGLEVRGEIAWWFIDNPAVLVANNDGDLLNDVGRNMNGWQVEVAYHLWPEAWRGGRGSEMDFVPFVRYSAITTQDNMLAGAQTQTNGSGNKDFLTFGASYLLNRNFIVKADYRINLDGTDATALSGANQDYFQLGVGVFF